MMALEEKFDIQLDEEGELSVCVVLHPTFSGSAHELDDLHFLSGHAAHLCSWAQVKRSRFEQVMVPVLTAAAAAAVEAQKLTTVQQAADKIASMAN